MDIDRLRGCRHGFCRVFDLLGGSAPGKKSGVKMDFNGIYKFAFFCIVRNFPEVALKIRENLTGLALIFKAHQSLGYVYFVSFVWLYIACEIRRD